MFFFYFLFVCLFVLNVSCIFDIYHMKIKTEKLKKNKTGIWKPSIG